jgi:hypothetical protein
MIAESVVSLRGLAPQAVMSASWGRADADWQRSNVRFP